MEVLVLLVALACYGLAAWSLQREGTPIYLFLALAGQLGMLATPLWNLLYRDPYAADLAVFAELFGIPLYSLQAFGAAWHYTLPAMITYYLYTRRWWFPNYVTALLAYVVFMFYHALIEVAGLNAGLWNYTNSPVMPPGISPAFLAVLMGALISLILLYVVMTVRSYSWQSLFVFIVPAPLLLAILVRGVIGAPYWIVQAIDVEPWTQLIGSLSTVVLTLVGVHIFADALGKSEVELA